MSRRTAESSKAIRIAWRREQERVKVGKGIRDWTPEQQQDIIDKGKAYDSDGRPFDGQHMKSAEKYPEFQGDPDNIQFLTRKEHLNAHHGNWRNPTNWYYDPATNQFTDFGDGKYIPCKVINLSVPININVCENDKTATVSEKKQTKKESSPKVTVKSKSSLPSENKKSITIETNRPKPFKKKKGRLSQLKDLLLEYLPDKDELVKIGYEALETVLSDFIAPQIKNIFLNTERNDDDYASNEIILENNNDKCADNSNQVSESKAEKESITEKTTRSYTPNDVPSHSQRYHYKDGRVEWIKKSPYPRGKNKNTVDESEDG